MRRFADPHRCPGCGNTLLPGSTTCAACGLDLSGPLGAELFVTLTRADDLMQQLWERSRSLALVTAGTAPSEPTAPPSAGPAMPEAPAPAAAPPGPAVRASSVPRILLALGALCLLVAALVFLVVTWSAMGVGGRTATLVGFTVTTGALTAWLARRGLRGATEALGLVTAGLATLDLVGAWNAGWLGDPSDATFVTVLGALLAGGSLAAVAALSRTRAAGFTSGELATGVGAALTSIGITGQEWWTGAGRALVALLVATALTAAVWRLVRTGSNTFRVAGWTLGAVTGFDWLLLVGHGLSVLDTEELTIATLWARLEAWPLLAAGALALALAAVPRLDQALRLLGATAGLVPLALLLVAPAFDETTGVLTGATLAVTLAAAALIASAPRPWGISGIAVGGLGAVVLAVHGAFLASEAFARYAEAAAESWTGTVGGRLPEASAEVQEAAPWLLPLSLLTLGILLWAVVRLSDAGRTLPAPRVLASLGAVAGLGGVAALLLHAVPVWSVVAVLVVVALALAGLALRRGSAAAAVAAGVLAVAAIVLSCYDERLNALTLGVSLVAAVVLHLGSRLTGVAAGSGAAVVLLTAGFAWPFGAVVDVPGRWTALAGIVAVALVMLGRPYLPVGLRGEPVPLAVEVGTAAGALGLGLAGLAVTDVDHQLLWSSVYLTVAGAAATALALLREDRRAVGWVGGFLLALASWLRLYDLGVGEPEPYTVPAAVALVVVGLVRLRRHPEAGTQQCLGAGLALGLVPSLLWTLDDPLSLRAALLGLTCLALVVGGVLIRWSAPVLYGAVAGALLVLREAGPYVGDSVPRWALIGAAGALLITMGVTWEQRLRDARAVASYVRGLR